MKEGYVKFKLVEMRNYITFEGYDIGEYFI